MSAIEFFNPDSIPEDVLRFWMERQMVQDRFMALTASPEWFAMMTSQRNNAVVAVVKDAGGTCRAVLPLFPVPWSLDFRLAGRCWYRRPLSALRVCGGDLIENDVIPADLATLWQALSEKYTSAQGIWFDHVGSGARTDKLRMSCSRGHFLVHPVFSRIPHYRLKLPPTVAELRSLRSTESLKKIRGRDRALGRAAGGECRLVEIRTSADWAPYLDRIRDLMAHTWQSQRLGHEFNQSSLSDLAGKGWLRSFLLMAGEKAAAFAFCFQGQGIFVYEQIGYCPDLAKYSPGTILLYGLLERLYERDMPGCVDFGEGEAGYKNLLANDTIQVDGLFVVIQERTAGVPFRLADMFRRTDTLLRRLARKAGTRGT